jgi:hypothetical protein
MFRKSLIIACLLVSASSVMAATGGPVWTTNGVACPGVTVGNDVKMISDGSGNFIAAYTSGPMSNNDIYAQKFNSAGEPQWGTGKVICNTALNQNHPLIVSDGAGGAVIAWRDKRDDINYQIYSSRIDADGNLVAGWTANGTKITKGAEKDDMTLIGDGGGGAFYLWADDGAGNSLDIRGQRLSGNGVSANWGAGQSGKVIYGGTGDQIKPRGVPYYNTKGSLAGAIIAFEDVTDANNAVVKAHKVDLAGQDVWPIPVTVSDWKVQKNPDLVNAGSDGPYYVVTEVSNPSQNHYAILGQKFDSQGTRLWTTGDEYGKLIIYNNVPYLVNPQVASDGVGAFVVWSHGPNSIFDIYAQKLNSQGESQWGSITSWGGRTGVPVCSAAGMQLLVIGSDDNGLLYNRTLQVVPDNSTAIVTWNDLRRETSVTYADILTLQNIFNWKMDVYAQKIRLSDGALVWGNGVPVAEKAAIPSVASDGSSGAGVVYLFLKDTNNYWPAMQKMADLSASFSDINPISPTYGPPGTNITLTGTVTPPAFGSDPKGYIGDPVYGGSMNNVVFESGSTPIPAEDITWSNSSITAKVPSGAAAGPHTFKVTAYGGQSSVDFVVPGNAPQITSVKFDGKFYYTPQTGEKYYVKGSPDRLEITAAITPSLTSATITTLKVVIDGTENDALSSYNATTGQLAYKLLSALTEGAHTISIKATDIYANTANTPSYPVYVESPSAGVTNVPSAVGYPGGKSFFNPIGAVAAGVSAKAATTVTIAYTLPSAVPVDLKLYGSSGGVLWAQTVPSGAAGASVGYNELTWDGRDVTGQYVGTGIYPYQIVSGGKVISRGHIVVSYQSQ